MNEIYSTAFLMGGLGNQMFQIANAYSQSLYGNVKCFFNPFSQTTLQGNNTSKYIGNIFQKLEFKEILSQSIRYYEPDWSYNDKKFTWSESIEFYGYYQSSKNFLNFSNEIRELFLPNEKQLNFLKNKYPKIVENNTLSIHIRRGDYVNFPNTHPIVTKYYIDRAIMEIGNYSNIFVFSDDKEWVYNNLKYDNIIYINDEDYLEMWLMSMCKNNIISNSTFSWWGSYLNYNPNKVVIAPSIWFGNNGPKNYIDIYENNWKIINLINKNGELHI